MTAAVSKMAAAEWTKLRDLPRSRQLLVITFAAAAATAVVLVLTFPATRGTALSAATAEEVLSTSVLGIDAAAAVLVVLAAWFTGVEFRTGAITESLLRTRRRSRIVAAKSLVVAAVAAVTGVLTAVVVTVAGIVLAASAAQTGWGQALTVAGGGDHVRLALGSALLPVLFSLLAVFGAVGFRSVAGGVLTPLAFLLGSTLAGWLPTSLASALQPLLPLAAVHSLSGVAEAGGTEHIGELPAFALLVLWVASGAVFAIWRLRRQDF